MNRLLRIILCGLISLSLIPVSAFAQPGPDQDTPPDFSVNNQRPPQNSQQNNQRPPEDSQQNNQQPPQNSQQNNQRPPQDSQQNNQRPGQNKPDNRRPQGPSGAEIAAKATAELVGTIAITALSMPIPADNHYVFGMDIRGFGDVATGLKTGGGLGLDMWFRPIRWVAVELYTDFVFNTNKDIYLTSKSDDRLLRMPIYLGARIHFFDYAAYNVYAAVAGGLNVQFITDEDSELGGGLQAGIGASYIISGFNIGIDVRYTMESLSSRFESKFIHGCIFALNIGFAR